MTVLFQSQNMLQIGRIAKRAGKIIKYHGGDFDQLQTVMDLDACNSNGCPLDFDKLEKADDFDLLHDVCGIAKHIDRETGTLTGRFLPRCAKPTS